MVGLRGIPATHGGVEQAVEQLAVNMVEQGHDVTVYCRTAYSKSRSSSYRGVSLAHLPSFGRNTSKPSVTHCFPWCQSRATDGSTSFTFTLRARRYWRSYLGWRARRPLVRSTRSTGSAPGGAGWRQRFYDLLPGLP